MHKWPQSLWKKQFEYLLSSHTLLSSSFETQLLSICYSMLAMTFWVFFVCLFGCSKYNLILLASISGSLKSFPLGTEAFSQSIDSNFEWIRTFYLPAIFTLYRLRIRESKLVLSVHSPGPHVFPWVRDSLLSHSCGHMWEITYDQMREEENSKPHSQEGQHCMWVPEKNR